MSGQVWLTQDGTRQVESILLDGHATFKVTDPRNTLQTRFACGFVRVITRKLDDGSVVLAQPTVTGLALLGVDLGALEA